MTDRLASLFESAVSMLPMSEARSLDLFTEITNYDESACDAWIGRIRCGDTDRVTLFRAWYSRRNFGQLSGSVQISMSTLNARIAIGGLYGDITYPVTSPLAITMGFAACEAAHVNRGLGLVDLHCQGCLVPHTDEIIHLGQRDRDRVDTEEVGGRKDGLGDVVGGDLRRRVAPLRWVRERWARVRNPAAPPGRVWSRRHRSRRSVKKTTRTTGTKRTTGELP